LAFLLFLEAARWFTLAQFQSDLPPHIPAGVLARETNKTNGSRKRIGFQIADFSGPLSGLCD
jgi:hypothetical protein